MKYGFIIPTGDPRTVVELASAAEAADWDGVFYYDASHFDPPQSVYDPWIVLAAIAVATERVRVGAVVFALPRRRPWDVAREAATLDHLSGGRLVLPVGLGAPEAHGLAKLGLPADRKTRAEMLDESLSIITGLWSGRPFSFSGTHYQLDEVTFVPPPLQERIPIWVIGAWGSERSMQRALRYDGLIPTKIGAAGAAGVEPDDVREIAAHVAARRRQGAAYDIVVEGRTPADDRARAVEVVRPWIDAGATWWLEAMWTAPNDLADVRARIAQGPPRGKNG